MLLLFVLFFSQKLVGFCNIFYKIANNIDFAIVYDYEKRLFINQLGIEGEIVDKILDKADYLAFELNNSIGTSKCLAALLSRISDRKLD